MNGTSKIILNSSWYFAHCITWKVLLLKSQKRWVHTLLTRMFKSGICSMVSVASSSPIPLPPPVVFTRGFFDKPKYKKVQPAYRQTEWHLLFQIAQIEYRKVRIQLDRSDRNIQRYWYSKVSNTSPLLLFILITIDA